MPTVNEANQVRDGKYKFGLGAAPFPKITKMEFLFVIEPVHALSAELDSGQTRPHVDFFISYLI
jgi:hypothetical protein